MNNPFIPKNRANIAIISGQAPEEIVLKLQKYCHRVISTVPVPGVSETIKYHPDIALFPLDQNTIVAAPSVFEYYWNTLEPLGINVIRGEINPGSMYPNDIPYNAAILGDMMFHLLGFTENIIFKELKARGFNLIDVKQGYTKCSTAIIDQNSAITADRKIAAIMNRRGCNVLLVEPGYIDLPGMRYGFIGGATGLLSPNELLLTGSLKGHPDWLKIERFNKNRNVDLIELSSETAIDLGSIITFSVF